MQARQPASNISVLVVDDEPRLLASLEALLNHKDYQVDTALGGKLACQQLEQNHYDLVLLDLNMGDFDGFAVMAYMADQGMNAAIVVVSGETTFDAVRKALRLGASDYVKKPYSPEELFATIDSTLHKKHLRIDALGAIVTDSSVQEAAREKQRKSNSLFSKAEQIGKLGHWEWDFIAKRYITCSEQYAKFFGVTVEQMLEKTGLEGETGLVCEDDRARYSQVFDAAMKRKQGWDIEYRKIDKMGKQVHLHEIGEPVLDDYGVVIKSVGTIQDITKLRRIEEELKQNHALFHQAEAIGSMGHFVWDRTGGLMLYCSDQFARIYGMTVSEVLDHFTSTEAAIDLIHPDDQALYRQAIVYSNEQSKGFDGEYRIITSSGDTRYVHERSEVVLDNDGAPSQSFGTVQDITRVKENESTLIQATEAALELSRELVFQKHALDEHAIVSIADAAGDITYVNNKFCTISGYNSEELLGNNHKMVKSDEHPDAFFVDMWNTIAFGHTWQGDVKNTNKTGGDYWVKTTIVPTLDDKGKPRQYVAILTEITERKQIEEKLKRIAHYDVLTNLPDRVLLSDRLSQAMAQCQRHNKSLAIAYMDLDGFKAVNDTHGHHAGDELLIALSQRMKEALREGDTLARIGGDEFIAVMVDLEKIEDIEPVLVRLLKAAADPVTVGDAIIQISASIGVTLYPQDGADADQLMRRADQAMYVAKKAGKNRYHLFDATQDI
jgi:diguanylate cyclase (GGDEF)-like protein/PAS domain S-box-containing protein